MLLNRVHRVRAMLWRKIPPKALENSNNHTLFHGNLYIDIRVEVYAPSYTCQGRMALIRVTGQRLSSSFTC